MDLNLLLYHGTYESAAIDILSSQRFNIGHRRDDHWLGQGVYFYREDADQAMIWGQHKVQNVPGLHGQKAAVIECWVSVQEDDFLNLDTRDGLMKFKEIVSEIDNQISKNRLELETNNPHVYMCLYCDQIPQSYKVIQRTFAVASSIIDKYPLFQLFELRLHGIQICVRDISVINAQSIKLIELKQVTIRRHRRPPRIFN